MSDWQSVCIGDIANLPKKQPVANPQAIELLTVRLYAKGVERTGKYPRATERGRPYFAREAGEILIGRQNFHNGGIGIVGKADHGLICSNAITSLIPNDQADKDFLFYLLSNSEFRNSIQKQSEGTGQSEISETKILSLELALPPLPEQKKIAEILSGIDKAIYNLKSCLGKQEILKKSLIGELISYADANLGISSKANYYCLGDISTRITDGTHQAVKTSNHGTIPFLYVSCVKDGIIDWSKSALISEEQYAVATQGRQPYPGDILYTAVGSYGNAVMVATNHRFCFQRHIALIQLDKEKAVPKFIELALSSDQTKKSVDQVVAGNAQPTLTLGELRKLQIPLPPLDIQRRICEIISPAEQKVASLENKINAMHHLKQSVSSDLLSGRKRVSV